MKKAAYVVFAMLFVVSGMLAQKSYDLKRFPPGSDPEGIGVKLVERYLETPHSYWGNIDGKNKTPFITYPDVCAWLGAMWFTQATKNEELFNRLIERFEPLFTAQKDLLPEMRPKPHNVVDWYVFGAVPLYIYRKNHDSKYLELGLKYADGQWILPDTPRGDEKKWHDNGYSWQTRLWIDDMFMITDLQAQAYLATGDIKYLNRTVDEMVLYLDKIQRQNGLFYHAPDAPFFWARGNGWMAVGMAELLRIMPNNNPHKSRIKTAYLQMMETLLRYQAYDGMWRQLIDDPVSWRESSGSAMFTYAMILGVKNGWLDKKIYGEAARKGWLALVKYLDENYNLREVCMGTGTKNSHKHYIGRPRQTGDLHGQAAMMWCAYALCSNGKSE